MNGMEEQRLDEILKRVNRLDPLHAVDPEECGLQEMPLPFYRDGTLVELTDYAPMLPLTRSFVATCTELIPLDGSRAAVEQANALAGLQLSDRSVVAYCRFWFRAVSGPEDSFKIVERIDDVEFTGPVDQETRRAVELALRPVRVESTPTGYRVEAFVLYADTLYRAAFAVDRNGSIDAVEEAVIREDVPTRDILLE
jgi:hypothetical protein